MAAVGAKGEISFWNGSECPRKGDMAYAESLFARLVVAQRVPPTKFVIVGDGLGDLHFFLNMATLADSNRTKLKVEGYFISQPDFSNRTDYTGNARFFQSWASLGSSLFGTLEDSPGLVLFIDIDRTLILPRGTHDDAYHQLKEAAISGYISRFRVEKDFQPYRQKIEYLIGRVSTELVEYNNHLNRQLFKNEEAVAIAVLLLCVGVVQHDRSFGGRPPKKLITALRSASGQIKSGGWLSGVDGFTRPGEFYWRKSLLLEHLEEVIVCLETLRPVVSGMFRRVEAALLGNLLRQDRFLLNPAIADPIKALGNANIILLTDRPAISFGLDGTLDIGSKGQSGSLTFLIGAIF